MKVPRIAHHQPFQDEQSPLSITANSKLTFKISPCLQKATRVPSQVIPRRPHAVSLLKAYLHFVQEETGATLELESTPTSMILEPPQDHQPHSLASSGTALIESLVHDPMLNNKSYNQTEVMLVPSDRPITTIVSAGIDQPRIMKRAKRSKRKQPYQARRLSTTINKKSSRARSLMTRCICANPHDEFGSMVQCDDCFYWLHLDCLDLDEDALGDTFQCPSCCSNGVSNSWRYSSQWQSKQLASHQRKRGDRHHYHQHHRLSTITTTDDDYDYDYDEPSDCYDLNIPKMAIDTSIRTTMTTPNVIVQAYSSDTNDMDDGDILDSETVESDWEHGYEPQVSSSPGLSIATTPPLVTSPAVGDTDSGCEVDTPGGPSDNTNFMNEALLNSTATMPCLDQESLFWLSHLSYLESLQSSTRRHCFTSHASDVFLCDDGAIKSKQQQQQSNEQDYNYMTPLSLVLTNNNILPSKADPPSTICSTYLSEYSFDEGPFWSPCR
ncbi:hypothetical protein BC941DRAFT_447548 [Chlamydoabsidia padenii]|nr:hypothetical protein BC941DRAFT_447548 [Chlamydoabsidia padenii]